MNNKTHKTGTREAGNGLSKGMVDAVKLNNNELKVLSAIIKTSDKISGGDFTFFDEIAKALAGELTENQVKGYLSVLSEKKQLVYIGEATRGDDGNYRDRQIFVYEEDRDDVERMITSRLGADPDVVFIDEKGIARFQDKNLLVRDIVTVIAIPGDRAWRVRYYYDNHLRAARVTFIDDDHVTLGCTIDARRILDDKDRLCKDGFSFIAEKTAGFTVRRRISASVMCAFYSYMKAELESRAAEKTSDGEAGERKLVDVLDLSDASYGPVAVYASFDTTDRVYLVCRVSDFDGLNGYLRSDAVAEWIPRKKDLTLTVVDEREAAVDERFDDFFRRWRELDVTDQTYVAAHFFGVMQRYVKNRQLDLVMDQLTRYELVDISDCCAAEVVAGGQAGGGREFDVCGECGRECDTLTVKRLEIETEDDREAIVKEAADLRAKAEVKRSVMRADRENKRGTVCGFVRVGERSYESTDGRFRIWEGLVGVHPFSFAPIGRYAWIVSEKINGAWKIQRQAKNAFRTFEDAVNWTIDRRGEEKGGEE